MATPVLREMTPPSEAIAAEAMVAARALSKFLKSKKATARVPPEGASSDEAVLLPRPAFERRKEALDELASEAERLGLGY